MLIRQNLNTWVAPSFANMVGFDDIPQNEAGKY